MPVRKTFAAALAASLAKVCLVATLSAGSPSAEAGIYKCKLGSSTTYQETPCEKHAISERLDNGNSPVGLVGCFDMAGMPDDQRFNIRVDATGPGKYTMVLGDKGESPVQLTAATPEDIRMLSDGLHIHAISGLKWVVPGSTDKKPIGVYTIKDKAGDNAVYGFFFLANGIMKREPCHS